MVNLPENQIPAWWAATLLGLFLTIYSLLQLKSNIPIKFVASSHPKTKIVVLSSPTGASISIDHHPKGVTDTTLNNISPGPHTIAVKLKGFKPESRKLDILPSKTMVVAFNLRPVPAEVHFDVTGAEKYAIKLGPPPFKNVTSTELKKQKKRLLLSPGLYEIIATATGYKPAVKKIKLSPGQKLTVHLQLRLADATLQNNTSFKWSSPRWHPTAIRPKRSLPLPHLLPSSRSNQLPVPAITPIPPNADLLPNQQNGSSASTNPTPLPMPTFTPIP